ncbi:PVC-type heme-binding CxxCH protein [Candidatus Laterigemmans baculatus]|uniref:PVC-type heme-binding CxxCH protein n=1 Tax=Candidatus Laterigemmans baculatus TaxID=2770505 RepID=UPI0013DD4B43|nr:PVC-type heme-binding CxxCH protein [Candidatus Laterigemmans baculatus]
MARGEEFPQPINTEQSTAEPMSAEETVRTATLPEGFELTVFAAEPDVQNPIAITTDHRGRLWVAENYTWAGSLLGNYRTDLSDRIVILEDRDGDGRHDHRTVFWDQAKKLTSIEVGFGGVWAIALPNLIFIPDADGDDVPDGPPVVVLDGLDEQAVGHTPANGLSWGPDGWLYARHGILATSSIGKPGAAPSQRVRINTGIWRYHPTRQTVEAVMHGMTNSWGSDYNSHGEMFCINTVIGHLWHVVPGAHTERMFGVDINPHAYQLIEQVADHVHWDTGEVWHQVRDGVSDTTLAAGGGHAHVGLMIYQGDNWPDSYRNRAYTLNLHGRRINCDTLERQGTGFVAKHAPDLAVFADPFFRGMDLITGADGGVLIADWSDTGECHDHDGVHRTSGRIYKLSYGKPTPAVGFDLSKASDQELVEAQTVPNAWWSRQARRILHERAAAGDAPSLEAARESLRQILQSAASPEIQLRAAWALHLTGGCDPQVLLGSSDEFLRAWGVRLIAEGGSANDSAPDSAAVLLAVAERDSSGPVALHLASSLQRLPIAERWALAAALAQQEAFADDRMFPILLWLGIEPAVAGDPARAIALASASQLPLLTQNIARRLTLEIDRNPRGLEQLLAAANSAETVHPEEILVGMALALRGWRTAPQPKNWTTTAERFTTRGPAELQPYLQQLSVVFGDGRAIDELRGLVIDATADPAARRQALAAILTGRPSDFAGVLQSLLGDRAVMLEALRGLALYDDPATPARALGAVGVYDPEARAELVNLLASRPAYARSLLEAVREGKLAAREISAFHAQQIRGFGDSALTEALSEVWGAVRATASEKRHQIESLKEELSAERLAAADLSQGRALFNRTCSACHVLYGEGHHIGPDLTGSNRKNLDYLLENIIDPSASVGADFRTTLFVLRDGRILNGVVRQQTERTITIQTSDPEPTTVERSEIEASKATPTSLMPDGLLQNLTAEQIRDLVAYLGSSQQVPLPE